jgi:hypothetical protein
MGRYSRRKTTAPIEAVDFTNKTGHIIKPGDPVIIMTTCTGNSELFPATYLGLRNGENVVVDICDHKTKFVNDKDEEYDWSGEYKELPYRYLSTNYRYGTPEYEAAAKTFHDEVTLPREEARKKRQEGYTYKKFPHIRRSTLQNNNVYPANLALKDFKM